MKYEGITFIVSLWIMLALAVAFSWTYFSQVNNVKDGNNDQVTDAAWNSTLVTSIISSVALLAVSMQFMFYTPQFKKMAPVGASLFFLAWLLMAATTAVSWLIARPENVNNNYLLVASVTSSVALLLFTIYFVNEVYPLIKKRVNESKSPNSRLKNSPSRKKKKSVK